MKKHKKLLSLLMCLVLTVTMITVGTTGFAAEGDGGGDSGNSGMVLNKTATANGDGTYTIQLEAYATGEKVITEVTEDIPTDIVLVLDQSGSMGDCIVCGNKVDGYNDYHNTFVATTNIDTNKNYYIKDGNNYTEVQYCNGTHSILFWSANCPGGSGWYTSRLLSDHTLANKITPKTNDNLDGTQFYEYTSEGCTSRLDSLKTAVTKFANNVAEKAKGTDGEIGTDDDVDHRIAVVGFASSGDEYNRDEYENTEVFVGDAQYTYGSSASDQYVNALQSMNTSTGQTNIKNSIGALAAYGGTFTNLGMEMANGIFNANPVVDGQKRNRVVIVFTDGLPGTGTYDSNVASAAITQAETSKTTYGATVYTVGVFSGADATSSGNQNGTEAQKANWFMQQVSSNNGTPRNPSYYLSAGDADTLNNIFQQISEQIETGGSSTTLSKDTVIKDIIAPAFTLPEGASASDITLETYTCTGQDDSGNYTWSNSGDAMGATATIKSTDGSHDTTTNNQVSVTGFDFAENYVGTVTENGTVTYRGNKLVIRFKVTPRPGFLGGNNVITNTSAGVYPDGNATDPILTFDQPNVDVTIKKPEITLPDANVYLGAYFRETVNAEDLKKGTSIKFGDNIVLDLTKPDNNWGLEEWQTEYVEIKVKVTDENGSEVTEFEKLTDDTKYKVSVSIKPKTQKEVNNGFDESMTGTIHVFKPELKFQDSTAYYGESVPANNNFSSNYVADSEKWKNGDKYSTDGGVKMLGTKPTLGITYQPDNTKLENNMYTKQDVPVKATVEIGSDDVTAYTTFLHQGCNPACGWTATTTSGDPAFLIHIRTCQLTITKKGGAADEPYVFTVYKNDKPYTEASITGNGSVTIYELPVGTYTINEDTGWSWRFSPAYSEKVVLSKDNDSGEITCTNTKAKNYWLNGFSTIWKNIFGSNGPIEIK